MASEPSDEALAARVARKDIAAFAILYDRYARRVYAWSAHMVGTAEANDRWGLADDVLLLRVAARAR